MSCLKSDDENAVGAPSAVLLTGTGTTKSLINISQEIAVDVECQFAGDFRGCDGLFQIGDYLFLAMPRYTYVFKIAYDEQGQVHDLEDVSNLLPQDGTSTRYFGKFGNKVIRIYERDVSLFDAELKLSDHWHFDDHIGSFAFDGSMLVVAVARKLIVLTTGTNDCLSTVQTIDLECDVA